MIEPRITLSACLPGLDARSEIALERPRGDVIAATDDELHRCGRMR